MRDATAGHDITRTRRRCVFSSALLATLIACGDPSGPSPGPAASSVCGNGFAEAGEECDDGNPNNADGCLTTCQRSVAWTTSDVHVHSTGCSQYARPSELAQRLERQQIQVAAALVWGEGYESDSAFFTGRDHPVSTPGFILHYDLEISRFVAARGGHLVLLGLDSLAFSSDVFHVPQSGVPIVEWARRQSRAVVGMAHGQFWPNDGSFPIPPGGCCTPFEVVVHAARGRLDFLSMEVPLTAGPGVFRLWKALQNAGLRVAIAGGSDFSCISQGFDSLTPRTDVIVDGALSYESWLAAIKAGRTAAAIGVGNHLNLRVEGRRLGEELLLPAAQEVTVTLETAGKAAEVQILVNGEVASQVSVADGLQLAQVRVPVSRSSWIAARSPYVLTSPVYVLVAGQPVRPSPDDICYLRRSVEHLSQLVLTKRLNLYGSETEALAAYKDASGELQRRFVESGGGTCG
jgi:cysteine-rich repeat protein